MIDGAPEVVALAANPNEDFIEMPAPMDEAAHRLNPLPADLAGEHRAEPVPPKPHRLAADVDTAFVQQIPDVSKRQRKPDVLRHRKADDLRRGF